jgi:GDPmannose 4,6-dehydratase
MLQHHRPDDYVIATGVTSTLQDFVRQAFEAVGLDWQRYVHFDDNLRRPSDLQVSRVDPGKAMRELGWVAQTQLPDVLRRMVAAARGEPVTSL